MQARFKRVALAAAIVAAFGTMLAYVGLASGAGKIQIAVFYYNPSPYGVASEKAAIVEAKKLGGMQITTFDANNDPTAQNTQMTDAITTGKYKGFWVWALNGVAEAPTIRQAEAKGIKVAVADYTLGDLNSQLVLSPTKGLVSTIGGSIGKQEQAFVNLIKLACARQVGANGTCNVAFMPGLANYPTDTLRISYMQGVLARQHPPDAHAARSVRPADVAAGRADVLPVEAEHSGLRLVRRPDDRWRDHRVQAAGDRPGQGPPGHRLGREPTRSSRRSRPAPCSGRSPCTRRLSRISRSRRWSTAIHGKKVPTTINVIDKNHPLIITTATLKTAKGFKPDWSLTGNPG